MGRSCGRWCSLCLVFAVCTYEDACLTSRLASFKVIRLIQFNHPRPHTSLLSKFAYSLLTCWLQISVASPVGCLFIKTSRWERNHSSRQRGWGQLRRKLAYEKESRRGRILKGWTLLLRTAWGHLHWECWTRISQEAIPSHPFKRPGW